jgi:hypothetical protein
VPRVKAIQELSKINKKYNTISLLRLLCIVLFLGSLYYYIQNSGIIFIISAVFFGFIVLMRIHSKLLFEKINSALVEINENEIFI